MVSWLYCNCPTADWSQAEPDFTSPSSAFCWDGKQKEPITEFAKEQNYRWLADNGKEQVNVFCDIFARFLQY